MTVSISQLVNSAREPWFRQRPIIALGVAVVLYASVLSLRLLAGGAVDAYSLLYVFPVALVAVTFGLRAGLAAGLVAVGLTLVWVTVEDVSLNPAGWASRVLPVLLLGLVLGDASDQLRRAETERRRLEAAALLYREAIEINDSLVQGMAAARWALEAGRLDAGLQTLEQTIVQAEELVSGLIRQAGMGGSSTAAIAPGTPLGSSAEEVDGAR
ncbi:hypothetical protein ACGFIF_07050 [Kribbella sp. NPDC049174]|uniref:hypothetical protein n=1 Tax=Kribbella sp. NPDC049174 TaxID=3364112 RepID=UPI0037187D12